MKRREFIQRLTASALAIEVAGQSNRHVVSSMDQTQEEASMAHRLGWAEFVARASAVFENVVDNETLDDEFYVYALAAIAARLDELPEVETSANAGLGPTIRTGPIIIRPRQPFFALKWSMDANAVLPFHNHPNYSFVTLVLEGSLRIRNFEIEGGAPEYDDETPFLVRQTQDQNLVPGRVNTLTRTRDYIHSFEAGRAGAAGIDIGILHTADAGFSYLEIGAAQTPSHFEARWDRTLTRAVRGG